MKKWSRSLYQPSIPLGYDGKRVTASEDHIKLSKEAAKEGMVLLKNENKVLPLQRGSRVALFGKASIDYVKGGGGSGDVAVPFTHNLYEGLQLVTEPVEVFEGTASFYKHYCDQQYAKGALPGLMVEPEIPKDLLNKAIAFTDIAIISISRFSGENWDRVTSIDHQAIHKGVDKTLVDTSSQLFERGDFYLYDAEEIMVEEVTRIFPKVVLVLNVGGIVDTSYFKNNDKIASVLLSWQGGMEGGLAAAELLMGIDTPSGKLSDTFASKLEDYPSSMEFHESDDYVDYKEDIFVGYRYFETISGASEKVNYPFGFGLSYTEFSIENVQAEEKDGYISISLCITNTGTYKGKEVVQVYFSAPQGKLGKASKELIRYQKTRLLYPGESQNLNFRISPDEMKSYDDTGKVQKSAYILEKGEYSFWIGNSIRNIKKLGYTFSLENNKTVQQLCSKMVPTSLEKRLLADGSFEILETSKPNDPNENILELKDTRCRDILGENLPAVRGMESISLRDAGEQAPKFMDVYNGELSLKDFLSQLSAEDIAWLLSGQENRGVANTFGYGNQIQYGIPNIMTADGPAGLRILPEVGVFTTAFPCATLLGCTWNPEIAEQVGIAGSAEVKENNIGVWLTPAVNIHRSPLCGRNFEYYSEDPYLTGKQAAAMVRGIQSNRVAATVKHFALNNKETNRRDSDSRASERAIREIYLKAFEIIVHEADPWSIMTSYNIINGHRASENTDLITGILRGEWGYQGMVTTDWWTYGENYKEVNAGNDVKMGTGYPYRLLDALEKGALSRSKMEESAERILSLILKID